MRITADIKDQEFENFVNHSVMNIFNDALSQQPPKDPIALMLQAHIHDFGKFSADVSHKFTQVDSRLDRVDVRLDHIDVRLDRIENTMATKEDLNAHALQNREDLNAQTVKIIDAVRKLLGQ